MGRPGDNQGTSMGPHSLGQDRSGQDRIMIDRLYINYKKADFDFENFSYEDKHFLSQIMEACDLIDVNIEYLQEWQKNRFDFFKDILFSIYFSTNRFILNKVNYQILGVVESKCLDIENIENYFNYFRTALINKLIE